MTHHPIPEAALDDRLGYVGTAGSGKTYNAGSGVERLLHRNSRCIIPDPLGVWYGLRLDPSGRRKSGFDVVIFGGPHGDLPLTDHAGALIGETVAGMKESCILDLSQLGTKAGERRFMLAFLTALYKHATGEPVHLVIDEADMWAPQKLLDRDGDAARLLGMMETIVRRGRVKGFIPWLITQRPAVLSKDVLSQIDGLVAFKLTSSHDRDAIGNWVEGQADKGQWAEIWKSLPTLERGQGVIWLPSRGTLKTAQFPKKMTFDSSATPKRGEKRSGAQPKPLNLGKLKERLATVEAETKANDPKALRARVAELEAAARKPAPAILAVDRKAITDAEKRGFEIAKKKLAAASERAAQRSYIAAIQALCQSHLLPLTIKFDALVKDAKLSMPPLEAVEYGGPAGGGMSAAVRPAVPRPTPSVPPQSPSRAKPAAPIGADGLSPSHRRIMLSLSFWRSIGHQAPTREQVAAVAGYRPGSGNFNNLVGGLSSSGQTTVPQPGRLSLAVDFDTLSADEARAKLWSVFDNPQRRLVEAAQNVAGDMSRDELAIAAGYAPASGNFNNITGRLTSMDVLRRTGTGRIELSNWARQVLT